MDTSFESAVTTSRWYDDRIAARRAFVLAMLVVSLLGWLVIHLVVVDVSVDTFVRHRIQTVMLPQASPTVENPRTPPADPAATSGGSGEAAAHRSLPAAVGDVYRPVLTLLVPKDVVPPVRFDDVGVDDLVAVGGSGMGSSGTDGGGPGPALGGPGGGIGGGGDTAVDDDHFVGTVDVEASIDLDHLRSRVVYPEAARRLHQEGRVVVKVWIAPDGTLSRISVAGSAGAALDAAALAAVEGMTASPARQGANAVGTWMYIPVMFVLP